MLLNEIQEYVGFEINIGIAYDEFERNHFHEK